MNESFFTAAVGAHQQLKRLTVHGNNIANLNTYGFKAEKSRFASLMYTDLKAIGEQAGLGGAAADIVAPPFGGVTGAGRAEAANEEAAANEAEAGVEEAAGEGEEAAGAGGFEFLPYGVGACLWTTDTDFKMGPIAETRKELDYCINGDGFFAIADLTTGEISLTRNGAFMMSELMRPTGEVDENGEPIIERTYYLSDNEGRFVLSTTGGMIEIEDEDADHPVGIFDYINYNGMEHVNDTLFRAVDKNGGIRTGTGTLMRGYLEMSNADLAEEMTKVIESQRAYGMALKMVQVSDEIETTINGLRG